MPCPTFIKHFFYFVAIFACCWQVALAPMCACSVKGYKLFLSWLGLSCHESHNKYLAFSEQVSSSHKWHFIQISAETLRSEMWALPMKWKFKTSISFYPKCLYILYISVCLYSFLDTRTRYCCVHFLLREVSKLRKWRGQCSAPPSAQLFLFE